MRPRCPAGPLPTRLVSPLSRLRGWHGAHTPSVCDRVTSVGSGVRSEPRTPLQTAVRQQNAALRSGPPQDGLARRPASSRTGTSSADRGGRGGGSASCHGAAFTVSGGWPDAQGQGCCLLSPSKGDVWSAYLREVRQRERDVDVSCTEGFSILGDGRRRSRKFWASQGWHSSTGSLSP